MQLQFMIGQNEFVEIFVFSGTTSEFGQPHLKLAYHILTIISDGAESE